MLAKSFRASIVVPAYNAEAALARCLAGLLNQTVPKENYEVIIVDDASTDGTAAVAAQYPVQVVRQPHGGPAEARNRGAKLASASVLVFTDADCVPTSTWLERMLRPIEDSEVVGAKGRYATSQHELVARFVQLEYEEKYQRMARERYIDFIDTYSAAYRKDVFLANGGFDTTFPVPSAEDQEFSFRLSEQGYKMVFVPDAVVFHSHPDSWYRYLRRKFRFGYWQVLNRWKHPQKLLRDSHTPQSQKLQLVLTAFLAPVVVAGMAEPLWWGGIPVLLGIFVLSALPLLRLCLEKDPPVAALLPLMLALRAVGVLAGLGVGSITLPLRLLLTKSERKEGGLAGQVSGSGKEPREGAS